MPTTYLEKESGYLRSSRQRIRAHNQREEIITEKTQDEKQEGRGAWGIFDSHLSKDWDSFDGTFKRVLPGGTAHYLAEQFGNHPVGLTGIELGGIGSKLFGGFPPGFFSATIGVSLTDVREPAVKVADITRNHRVVATDIFNPHLTEILFAEVGMSRFSVILERMVGGLIGIPNDPYFIFERLNAVYRMLKKPGVMALQYPSHLKALVPAWQNKIEETTVGLEIVIDPPHVTTYPALRITKRENAPQNLPALTPREVRRLYNEYELQAAQTRSRLANVDRGFVPSR